ncbi:tRNA uracil 4-sulfurtransferase ThiI [Anoxybacillus flavithermus]|uniref:Probable tRNA sulfurtransferase n=1 Tax=Anoxybacillus flavithermus TaxID=33934 RepID=A0A178TA88_9BACL|nr:tRNA uracil 4-sulfurtransferase ThiI [Anoxybacillus flavithermus]MBE2913114.1 tRNA 4-thiouridine(8) synthase ThiI [Anoxybacillus flavithermus]MBE2922430.1 tRNA 4-thiouridine(8) synthase ThiI [Anoxybacillus flavithermus]MBE2927620.1 tRNA 4-thiouridine(8) synthase ThiI [Anoxybacillus flavithermus]MBE2930165.1 tRNA 4-thiouridine(8) synthase ThiI [Anoxybacillus flavithermus]MBE2931059.1 tRNA 4-thiouridine(8) synthase ThiI [Anoxybacillus flavithermus]
MTYDHIVVRYGEMSTKGKNRLQFVRCLKRNVARKLKHFPNVEIEASRDRMYIRLHETPPQLVIEKLREVFGIQSLSLALKTDSDLQKIKEATLFFVKQFPHEGKTFKISARRADKQFPVTTNELNYELGSYVLKNTTGLTVDVHHPDIDVRVEVRKEGTYITAYDVQGAGGLPVGTSGKAMLMLSGGIDSPVAGYLAMKRGLQIEAVHFFSPPFTSERAKQKVIDLAQRLTEFGGTIRLHIVPFTELQQAIYKQVPENYSLISTRRAMLRITDEIRKKENGLAIVTGESLGQVASQTLESMVVVNDVTTTPILRPLISMDKTEIISLAERIGTHHISIRPYEDCCTIFTPKAPKTKPKKEKVIHYEQFLPLDKMIAETVARVETITLRPDQPLDELF